MARRHARKTKLTELFVRKLKPEFGAYLVWDTHQRGLAIRTQPSGSKAWMCVYSYRGRPRWYHLGDANAIGLAAARKLTAEVMLDVIRGKDPAAEKRAERGAGTFAELAERYVEQYAKRHNKSWSQPDRLVRRYLLPKWGKLQATTISRADVKAILADSEVLKFWTAFDDAGLIMSSALKVILLTGQRPGEVAHMRREHIKDGWWEMPGAPVVELGWPGTKNGESHRVWLSASVREIIAGLGDGDTTGCVFAGSVRGLDQAMRAIVAKLKIERATPHDLRRSFLSRVTGLGFGRDAMDRIANHKENATTDVYDRHSYAVEDQHIMEAVAARIMALATGESDDKVVPIRR